MIVEEDVDAIVEAFASNVRPIVAVAACAVHSDAGSVEGLQLAKVAMLAFARNFARRCDHASERDHGERRRALLHCEAGHDGCVEAHDAMRILG